MTHLQSIFEPEICAGLLLDQNWESDVLYVWVGDDADAKLLGKALEHSYKCTVIQETPHLLTVCCPPSYSDAG